MHVFQGVFMLKQIIVIGLFVICFQMQASSENQNNLNLAVAVDRLGRQVSLLMEMVPTALDVVSEKEMQHDRLTTELLKMGAAAIVQYGDVATAQEFMKKFEVWQKNIEEKNTQQVRANDKFHKLVAEFTSITRESQDLRIANLQERLKNL